MVEEKEIEFTDDEIVIIRTLCKKKMTSEPTNAYLMDSILQKLSDAEPENISISVASRPEPKEETTQPIVMEEHNPLLNLFQKVLQKLRQAV